MGNIEELDGVEGEEAKRRNGDRSRGKLVRYVCMNRAGSQGETAPAHEELVQ